MYSLHSRVPTLHTSCRALKKSVSANTTATRYTHHAVRRLDIPHSQPANGDFISCGYRTAWSTRRAAANGHWWGSCWYRHPGVGAAKSVTGLMHERARTSEHLVD